MHRFVYPLILAVVLAGCGQRPASRPTQPPESGLAPSVPAQRFVSEHDARLIASARTAAISNGFSLADAVYQVRADGPGWVVQVDRAPGDDGRGDPSMVVDGTFFVQFTHDEMPVEILSHGRWVTLTTRPAGGE